MSEGKLLSEFQQNLESKKINYFYKFVTKKINNFFLISLPS